ncbi:cupredoxin domain-containing protein [Conexibacter sp. JD483]|uniref:cupredoxin domain-containing protein n=1 Tax=unclassified Conexibacter TaxID=2627773 RepID=UPI00271E1081|nr:MULTISPECIES: cupredoxin domain-containing protein [unclassified Conexibacter]MDO8187321.1 cupredoxin domain-containing protein [Conexibacter sp. CPCC 205706]MDO8200546.1 cupredoxin domain-containing protein [Conexibacter sp. CPCC 205762]MDR9369985.1 cupredoxin domain-containing protein [Conexibacter sp. JD483]
MPKNKCATILKSALVVTAVALGGCGGGEQSGGVAVEMRDDLTFAPAEITVAPGQEIRWRNDGEVPHDVVAEGIGSPLVRGGEEWSTEAPAAAGTLAYACSLHPGMRGRIVVE